MPIKTQKNAEENQKVKCLLLMKSSISKVKNTGNSKSTDREEKNFWENRIRNIKPLNGKENSNYSEKNLASLE